jgi:MFS family permease
MYSESDLEAAVAAGALRPEAADALRTYVSGQRATPSVDEEHFRLLTGFNDIFVGVAAALLLAALAWIGGTMGPRLGSDGPGPVAGILVAVASWGLAEFFTRRRRMALPSILLLLAFILATVFAAATSLALVIGEPAFRDNQSLALVVLGVGAAAGVAAAWFHWRRFRVPITIAAGAAALAGVVLALIGSAVGNSPILEDVLLTGGLVAGVAVFLFAMWWDASDPRRETRRSDVAFWLHLLAAPLIVHPIFALLGLTDGGATTPEAMIVLLVYVLLGLTALAIDRRALLVSALAYVLYALSDLFERFGAVELNVALTALIIGSALLLLSAFWANARRLVVNPLPQGLRAKLPVLDRAALTPRPAS